MERHEIIREAIEQAGSTYVSVAFLKKDGSFRQMTFNPCDKNEIKGTGSACSDVNIFRVREAQNYENHRKPTWRSFDARRVIRLKTQHVELKFTNDIAWFRTNGPIAESSDDDLSSPAVYICSRGLSVKNSPWR